jgi:hypothetical protein
MLRLFWINFEDRELASLPVGTRLGIGVTAENEAEAAVLAGANLFQGADLPAHSIRRIETMDEVDPRHVRPNMGNHLVRGIWFPLT